jgi:hypothetical protein
VNDTFQMLNKIDEVNDPDKEGAKEDTEDTQGTPPDADDPEPRTKDASTQCDLSKLKMPSVKIQAKAPSWSRGK